MVTNLIFTYNKVSMYFVVYKTSNPKKSLSLSQKNNSKRHSIHTYTIVFFITL